MFKIVENNYIKSHTVKYSDELGNKLMIIAPNEQNSSEIRIKLRPAANVIVDRIVLKFPFTEEGINFHIEFKEAATSADEDYVNSEMFRDLLIETRNLAEKWVHLWADISVLTNNNISLSEKDAEEILLKLDAEEETHEFSSKYRILLNSFNE